MSPDALTAIQRLTDEVAELRARLEERVDGALLSTKQSATLLHHDEDWVRSHAAALAAVKVGGKLLFPREGIDAYLLAHRVGETEERPARKRTSRRRSRRQPASAPALAATGTPVMDW